MQNLIINLAASWKYIIITRVLNCVSIVWQLSVILVFGVVRSDRRCIYAYTMVVVVTFLILVLLVMDQFVDVSTSMTCALLFFPVFGR
jgi:hypothetical protein